MDPGLVLWLETSGRLSATEIEHALEHESGLLGLSGVSGDLREVLEAADGGNEAAAVAYAVYVHRLRAGIAAMTAALGGLDAIVFTGGAGEHSPRLRRDAAGGLGFLGVTLDEHANRDAFGTDAVVSTVGSPVAAAVVAAREDAEIARQVRNVLGQTPC